MSSIRLALFGQPVSHSPSPRVHRAFGAQFGIDVDYRLIEASPETFPDRLQQFRSEGGAGCNITLPLKGTACELADERSDRAELAGAANTLWWSSDGRCQAGNTDGEGLVRDIEQNLGISIQGSRVMLLGAGGAAAGSLGALLDRRPSRLVLVNRTLERARELADRHADLGEIDCLPLNEIERTGASDLVIDATSMGHGGHRIDLPPPLLDGVSLCYSLNYGPAADPMREACAAAGIRFSDGLGMLVEQAAISFAIWTDHRPDSAPVRQALADLRV